MEMNPGGHLVARALREEGVTHLFTLCGGHIQNIYDGCLDHGIRVVDVRHEQTAAHAADAWARVTGQPGVAAVTAGPGVTDTVTAVANAQRAQVPMVLIGGAGPIFICGSFLELVDGQLSLWLEFCLLYAPFPCHGFCTAIPR